MTDRYASIRHKVHLAEGPLDKAFPELFKHKEFQKLKSRPDSDRIIKYINFLYDKNTQLIHEYQSDLKARKEEAAKDAGYRKLPGGTWSADIQKAMDIQDADVTAAIMRFLKIQHHNVWTEIVVTEQELFEFQSLRFTSIGSGKKSKKATDEKAIFDAAGKKEALMKACEIRIRALDSLYDKFLGDNKDLLDSEFEEAITPEKAERILATMPPPYEDIKTNEDVLSDKAGE